MGKLFGENSVMNMSNSILGGLFYSLQLTLSNTNKLLNKFIINSRLIFFETYF